MSLEYNNIYNYSFISHDYIFLISFIFNHPKANDIFKAQTVSNEITFLANQSVENCICFNKKKNFVQINDCHHIFCYKCIS